MGQSCPVCLNDHTFSESLDQGHVARVVGLILSLLLFEFPQHYPLGYLPVHTTHCTLPIDMLTSYFNLLLRRGENLRDV